MKATETVGIVVLCILSLGSCMGAGTQQHMKEGKLENPIDLGYFIGVEGAHFGGNAAKVFFRDRLQLEDEQQQAQKQAQNQDSWWNPFDGTNGTSSDQKQCAGNYDLNCDGKVTDEEVQRYLKDAKP